MRFKVIMQYYDTIELDAANEDEALQQVRQQYAANYAHNHMLPLLNDVQFIRLEEPEPVKEEPVNAEQ